jgi:hypothetical protein
MHWFSGDGLCFAKGEFKPDPGKPELKTED